MLLLAEDHDRQALLLESLGPSLQRSSHPVEEQLRLLADTLALAWQPATDRTGPPAGKAGALADLVARLWTELGRPCPEVVVEQALQ